MKNDPKVGLAGPRLQWENGDPQVSCFRDRTPMSEFLAAARTGPLDRLEAFIGENGFAVGDSLSIADCAIVPVFLRVFPILADHFCAGWWRLWPLGRRMTRPRPQQTMHWS